MLDASGLLNHNACVWCGTATAAIGLVVEIIVCHWITDTTAFAHKWNMLTVLCTLFVKKKFFRNLQYIIIEQVHCSHWKSSLQQCICFIGNGHTASKLIAVTPTVVSKPADGKIGDWPDSDEHCNVEHVQNQEIHVIYDPVSTISQPMHLHHDPQSVFLLIHELN